MLRPWFDGLDMASVHVVTQGPACWFVRSILRQGAMTVSPYIFFGRDIYDTDNLRSVALLAHELKHVQQYRARGHVVFLSRYLWDLARRGFRCSPDLPLEAEAYKLQAEVRQTLAPRFPTPQ